MALKHSQTANRRSPLKTTASPPLLGLGFPRYLNRTPSRFCGVPTSQEERAAQRASHTKRGRTRRVHQESAAGASAPCDDAWSVVISHKRIFPEYALVRWSNCEGLSASTGGIVENSEGQIVISHPHPSFSLKWRSTPSTLGAKVRKKRWLVSFVATSVAFLLRARSPHVGSSACVCARLCLKFRAASCDYFYIRMGVPQSMIVGAVCGNLETMCVIRREQPSQTDMTSAGCWRIDLS